MTSVTVDSRPAQDAAQVTYRFTPDRIEGVTLCKSPVSSSSDHFPGAYQIGELQARSWMVAGTLVSGGMFIRTAS